MRTNGKRGFLAGLSALATAALLLGGCSTNPATGESSFTAFMDPEDEWEVAQEEHPKILQSFGGEYSNAGLQAYVDRIGRKLVAHTETPDLDFRFIVLDTKEVNAFALPASYIYITRGMLALLETEAELASVLAHEIGHVVARHAAQRYSQNQAANIGLTFVGLAAGMLGAPMGTGTLLSLGAEGYLKGYSRDQELEADRLAIRYMARAGYRPGASVVMFSKLAGHSRLTTEIAGGDPDDAKKIGFFATHPQTEDRIVQAIELVSQHADEASEDGRDAFLSKIDGMTFGDSPRDGVRRGRSFQHPGLGVAFEVPAGFSMINTSERVLARGPDGSGIVFDLIHGPRIAAVKDLGQHLHQYASEGVELTGIKMIDVNGMQAATGMGEFKERDARFVLARERTDRLYRFVFLSKPERTQAMAPAFQRVIDSFRRLSPREAVAVQPLRVRLVRVLPGETIDSISTAMPIERWSRRWFMLINGMEKPRPLAPGAVVKAVGN